MQTWVSTGVTQGKSSDAAVPSFAPSLLNRWLGGNRISLMSVVTLDAVNKTLHFHSFRSPHESAISYLVVWFVTREADKALGIAPELPLCQIHRLPSAPNIHGSRIWATFSPAHFVLSK